MNISRPVAFGAGVVMALVLASGTAVAATGGKFILGKSNSATTTTVLKNTRGTALQLTSKPGTPSLKVGNTVKVPLLNADTVDGIDSSRLALAAGQTNTVKGFTFTYDWNEDGIDDYLTSIATCPAGTRLTGGGADTFSTDGSLFVNSPLDKQSWMVMSSTTDLSDTTDLESYAVCYNPRGGISGAEFRTAPAAPSAKTLAAAKARLAPKLG